MPVYQDRSSYAVNQGDVFDGVPFPVGSPDGGPAVLTGIVISHDCDLDKYLDPKTPLTPAAQAAWRITMAPVHPVDDLERSRAKLVREDRMPRYFRLPPEGILGDLCADLWMEQPVLMTDVLGARRLGSLSAEMRHKLWFKIIRLRLGQHYRLILEGKTPPDAA